MPELISEIAERASRRQFFTLGIPACIFLGALYIFVDDQLSINTVNGWWWDEFFSLWASDPAQRFTDALSQRILSDTTNPPLYYSVLYWTRMIIADERSATTFINLLVLTTAVLSVLYIAKKTDNLPFGLIGCAAFLLSGPVLEYTAEGRSYLSALALTFVASWLSASAILIPERPIARSSFALLGALSAMIHVYSALMCGCIAAGLLVAAWFWRRSDLWSPSLALGVPASAITLAWLGYGTLVYPDTLIHKTNWHVFSLLSVLNSGYFVLHVLFDSMTAFALTYLLFVFGLASSRLRAASMAFGVCFLLFFLLPIAASFKQPIIAGHYWLIGAPAVIVLLLFLIRGWIQEVGERAKWWPFSLSAALAAVVCVGVTSLNGFDAARSHVMKKPVYRGAALVSTMIQNCPARSVHVLTEPDLGPGSYPYAFLTKMPENIFIPVKQIEREGGHSSIGSSCPVLGWAEILVWIDSTQKPSDSELLSLLEISAAPADVEILRHSTGYVVLRRNPRGDPR